jgi:hypothetical protein
MIHVLFNSSAAGTLRQLLSARGLRHRVVDLTDALDFGPISTGSFEDRETWLDHYVPSGIGSWDWLAEHVDEFRDRVAADSERLIWIAPSSASEQSGLYWYLAQFGGAGAQLIVADYPVRDAWRGEPPYGLGALQQASMGELLDECHRLPAKHSRFPEHRWKGLMNENALIRVVDNGVLRSAPDDYFDQFLLAHCPVEWTKWRRVVGDTMFRILDLGHSACDRLLIWRLRELIQREEIACDGALPVYGSVLGSKVSVRRAL